MFNGFDISTIQSAYICSTPIREIWYSNNKIWPSTPSYENQYLTFEAIQPTTFRFSSNDLQYSLDDGQSWTTLTAGNNTPQLAVGDKILWKQTGLTPASNAGIGKFSATGNFEAYGNVMSLYYGDNFVGEISLTRKNYAFAGLFSNNTYITNVENLILPATTLANYCYQYMFDRCTSLTTAPTVLPATTLAVQCYYCMFNGCYSLTSAPELPATTLTNNCYCGMFQNCTSLTTAPELPATILANDCYSGMFSRCTSLTIAPELPVTTLVVQCYSSMFQGCTSLTTAPELPATTLARNCYKQMFYGCTSLNYIKCLATNISASSCTNNWVGNVAATGTFVKDASMTSWSTGTSGIPTNWSVVDA